jgi:hypothetical protein
MTRQMRAILIDTRLSGPQATWTVLQVQGFGVPRALPSIHITTARHQTPKQDALACPSRALLHYVAADMPLRAFGKALPSRPPRTHRLLELQGNKENLLGSISSPTGCSCVTTTQVSGIALWILPCQTRTAHSMAVTA